MDERQISVLLAVLNQMLLFMLYQQDSMCGLIHFVMKNFQI